MQDIGGYVNSLLAPGQQRQQLQRKKQNVGHDHQEDRRDQVWQGSLDALD